MISLLMESEKDWMINTFLSLTETLSSIEISSIAFFLISTSLGGIPSFWVINYRIILFKYIK